jgi:hypothetical protein
MLISEQHEEDSSLFQNGTSLRHFLVQEMKRQISSRELWKQATNDETYSHRPNALTHSKAISCDAISENDNTSTCFILE